MAVCVDMISRGYYVFRSVSSSGPIDMIGMKDGKLVKVEVKTGYRRPTDGGITKPVHRHEEHDIMAVYLPEEKIVVYFPELEVRK